MTDYLLDVILFYMILRGVWFSHWYTNRAIKETQERRQKIRSAL